MYPVLHNSMVGGGVVEVQQKDQQIHHSLFEFIMNQNESQR